MKNKRKKIVFKFLKKGKYRLNSILILYYILKSLLFIGGISGILYLLIRLFIIPRLDIQFWLIALGACVPAGLIAGLFRRLNINDSALWLDAHLKTKDAFSSFLYVKNNDDYNSLLINKRAESILKDRLKIKWPLRKASRLLIITAAFLILIGLMIKIWPPVLQAVSITGDPDNKITFNLEKGSIGNYDEYNSTDLLSEEKQKKIAQMLFPNNREMAEIAEKALYEGDFEKLKKMVEKQRSLLNQNIGKGKGQPDDMDNLLYQQEMAAQILKNELKNMNLENLLKNKSHESQDRHVSKSPVVNKNTDENSVSLDAARPGSADTGEKSPDAMGQLTAFLETLMNQKAQNKQPADLTDKILSGNNNTEGMEDDNTDLSPGTGKATKEIIRRNFDSAKTMDVIIKKKEDNEIIEYLSRDKDPKLMLTEILPFLEKSAESAVDRDDLPFEYKESVESYFLELSKEANK